MAQIIKNGSRKDTLVSECHSRGELTYWKHDKSVGKNIRLEKPLIQIRLRGSSGNPDHCLHLTPEEWLSIVAEISFEMKTYFTT